MATVSDYTALLNEYDWRWNTHMAVGTPAVVTFSFAQSLSNYQSANTYPDFTPLTETQKNWVRQVIATVDPVSGLDFVEVHDSDQAQIRFGVHDFNSTSLWDSVAYAYYPGSTTASVAGDVWFNSAYNLHVPPGTFGYEVIIHELGHALGLKHPHDGNLTLASNLDNNANTVMTYNSSSPYAQETKHLDNQALSFYYGDNFFAENAVNASYIAASNRIKVEAQITNGQGTAFSGTQMNDLIIGTAGHDTIAGAAGNDVINGGSGTDRVIYFGNSTDYTITFDNGLYTIRPNGTGWAYSADGTDFLVDVETISFLGYDESADNSTTAAVQTLAALAVDQSTTDLVYRFFNTATGTHFYTATTSERNTVVGNDEIRSYEGGAFKASTTQSGAEYEISIFRFYNTLTGNHFYTGNETERDIVIRDLPHMTYEGTAYFSFSASDGGSHTELYRFYNTQNDSHFYTANAAERDQVINTLGHYNYEGVAYYVDL